MYSIFWLTCPDRAFKKLNFGAKIVSLAAIETEIWLFECRQSGSIGQILLTHIFDPGWPKNLKFCLFTSFMSISNCTNFHQNLRWWGLMGVLIWYGMTLIKTWFIKRHIRHFASSGIPIFHFENGSKTSCHGSILYSMLWVIKKIDYKRRIGHFISSGIAYFATLISKMLQLLRNFVPQTPC